MGRRAAEPAWAAGWPPILQPFGSSSCYLAHGSGLDLTLLFEGVGTGLGFRFTPDAQRSLIAHLHRVLMSVRQQGDQRWISVELLLHSARFPMLRLVDARSRMRVDLCVAEHLGLANTAMLRVYGLLHPAFSQLVLFIKHWSQRRRVNGALQGCLSSYAWSLLVLFVMQTAEPRALPVLQSPALTQQLPRKILNRADGAQFDCTFCDNTSQAHASINFIPETQLGFGELLLRFFALYSTIEWDKYVVSVRTGQLQPRPGVNPNGHSELHPEFVPCQGPVSIEDPFEVTRELAEGMTPETCGITRSEIHRAHALLSQRDRASSRGRWPWASCSCRVFREREGRGTTPFSLPSFLCS